MFNNNLYLSYFNGHVYQILEAQNGGKHAYNIRIDFQVENQFPNYIILFTKKMPRTELLSNVNPNHIYALNAQVKYTHHGPNMTTAIIEDQNIQSKIKIPNSLNNVREEIEEGINYHFGYCYIAPNGWIKARNPDSTIRPSQENGQVIAQPMPLSDIANNSQSLNGHYLTTLLYVVKVNESQQVVKQGKSLTMCILNCYANGSMVDVTLWNSDLPIADMAGKWIVFSGFRLKKLIDWKFVFVSSVYSKIAPYEGETKSIPYSPIAHYHHLSCIFEPRTVSEILKLSAENQKFFSNTEALLKKVENYKYEGCSVCKRKILDGNPCNCAPNTDIKVYLIQKLTLAGSDQSTLEAAVFQEDIQNNILSLKEPVVLKFNIKSSRKTLPTGEVTQSHVIAKVSL